jgi:hypothetical protein
MAHSPCFFSPCRSPFVPPSGPSSLTWNSPSCDRIRPPRSQVACKLTSPVPTLYPNPPPSKFPEPQMPSALLRRPQEQSGVFCPEQLLYTFGWISMRTTCRLEFCPVYTFKRRSLQYTIIQFFSRVLPYATLRSAALCGMTKSGFLRS